MSVEVTRWVARAVRLSQTFGSFKLTARPYNDPFAAVTDGPISERPTRVPCFEKSLKLMARLGLPVRSSRSVIGCASMRSTSCNS